MKVSGYFILIVCGILAFVTLIAMCIALAVTPKKRQMQPEYIYAEVSHA